MNRLFHFFVAKMRTAPAIVLCLVSAAALAYQPELKDGWALEYTTVQGGYERLGGYVSKEACEAALPKEIERVKGYNGHCIQFVAKEMSFIGSQDPKMQKHQ